MSTLAMRSFVVFRDDTTPSPTSSVSSLPEIDSALRSTSPSPSIGVSAPDKENVNPVTGRKAPIDPLTKSKKRKEDVLSTKAYAPTVKKAKDTKTGRSFGTNISSKKTSAQPSKRTSTSRRNTTSRSRRTPPLPPVDEDQETEAGVSNIPEGQLLSQTEIDARCYELTVLPLADLSKAYEQAPCLQGEHALSEKLRAQELTQKAVEDAQLVYGGSDRAASPAPSSAPSRSSSPARSEAGFSAFSTPERKRIYSAFTFSSPSPSSARYAAFRGSDDTRFSDPAFEL
ncbi:hypothetical protein DAEQUDRAFT_814367 [Daedalea quercina L-15889]|uniref:Uncharacterized protein n=1 Tax=Daedalea quercina L-15889 TaxID=1314783 RepID=A0A165M6R7_9APHY|nr:hypothetical protein DAEQUDRAFT_814367 [Daedalea quercina L-15889]